LRPAVVSASRISEACWSTDARAPASPAQRARLTWPASPANRRIIPDKSAFRASEADISTSYLTGVAPASRFWEPCLLRPSVSASMIGAPLLAGPVGGKRLGRGSQRSMKSQSGIPSALRLEPQASIDYVPYVRKLRKVTIVHAAAIGGAAVTLSLAAVPGAPRGGHGDGRRARARGGHLGLSARRGPDRLGGARHAGHPLRRDQGLGRYLLPQPLLRVRRARRRGRGAPVMPYVFANPGRSGGAATANFAAGAIGAHRGSGRLPLVVDLENDPYKKATDCYGLGIPAMIAWIAGFTGRARAVTGKWPTIYTTADWWRECTGSTGRFPHDRSGSPRSAARRPPCLPPGRAGRSGSTTMPARCQGSATRTWTTTSRPTAFLRFRAPRRRRRQAKHRAKSARRRRRPSGI